ncbi:MAG: hypothetical protein VX738_00205 [Planctomycetota bacterium]|nr:hypothetical protein [Planctomycetota bacterium]
MLRNALSKNLDSNLKIRTFWLLAVLPWLTGCPSWNNYVQQHAGLPPQAFQGKPTLEMIMTAVNTSQLVHQLQTQNARISIPGAPSLKANVIIDRPRRFRLTAGLFDFTRTEVDLGSNAERAWLWIREQPEPAVYYVRHDQLASTAAKYYLPIDINWLTEAMGLIYLDPAAQHEGPFALEQGKYEIRTRITSPMGPLNRRLIVDDRFGWVLEQHLTLDNGKSLASVTAGKHSFYPRHGVSLPHRIHIQLFPGQQNQLTLQIDIPRYQINQNTGDASQLWTMPQYDGFPQIDLSTMPAPQTSYYYPLKPTPVTPVQPPNYQPQIASPRFRGDHLIR